MKHLILTIILFFTLCATAQDYKKQWDNVTTLESVGEFKKAALATDAVYALAKKNKNEPQLLKAFFFKSKYLQMLEPDAQVLIIANLQDEIKTATPATKAIMESLQAQMLQTIYSRNSYTINRRTDVAGPTPKNINEWSGNNFNNAVEGAYRRSIANREVLYNTPLSKYDDIVEFAPVLAKTNRSVYDFLLSTYLDYERTAPNHKPAGIAAANYPYIFGNEAAFQKAVVTDSIAGAGGGMGLKLCQEAEAFYTAKKDTYALQRAVLRRLEYAYQEILWDDKNEAYIKILGQLATAWGDSPFAYRALMRQAQLYNNTAHKKDHPDYKDKALALCNLLLANKNKHDVAFEAENLKGSITNVEVTLTTEKFVVPGKPSLAQIAFKNPGAVTVSFYRSAQQLPRKPQNQYRTYIPEFRDSLLKTKPVITKTYTLPNAGGHFNYTTEVMLPALPKGVYVVAICPVADSLNPNDCGFTTMQVAQVAVAQQKGRNITNYYITDTETGQPVKGVKATTAKGTYASNNEGRVSIPHVEKTTKNEEAYIAVQFTHQGDTLNSNYYNYVYDEPDETEAQVNVQVYFDRAIYRPGQKVFFKGIATTNKMGTFKVVPNVYFSVYADDASGKEFKEYRLKTNEFGSFTGEIDLPKTGMTGTFTLRVEADDDEEADPAYDHKNNKHPFWDNVDFYHQEYTFKVEEYKRPTFDITFNPVTKAYVLNDSITVTGQAKSFSGAAVAGAIVEYTIRREENYGYKHYYDFDEEEGDLIDTDETTTDAEGNFTIRFKAEASGYKTLNDHDFTIYAEVTDINGETHTETFTVTAGTHLLYPDVQTAKSADALKGTQITFNVANVNAQPMPAQGVLKIYKTPPDKRVLGSRPWPAPELQTIPEDAFVKAFPHTPYGNEADNKRQPGAKPYFEQQVNTGKQKILTLNNTKDWPSGEYEVEFIVTDSLGHEEKATATFMLERKSDTYLPDNNLYTFKVINQNTAKDGFVKVEVRTALPVIYGKLVAATNNKLIYDKPIVVKNGRAVVKVPIPKNTTGLMAVRFDFIWNKKLYDTDLHVAVTLDPDPMDIEMEATTSKLAPGAEQTWKFTIKNGKKREAEVLAGMYDAALDQFTTKEWNMLSAYDNSDYYYYYNAAPATDLETYGTGNGRFNNFIPYRETNISKGDSFYMYGFDIIKSSNIYVNYLPRFQVKQPGDTAVSGVVSDITGPLPGATVVISGTGEGTITDIEGQYTIYVAKGEEITFSYIGYKTVKKTPTSATVNITFDEEQIEAVIIDIYRTQTRAMNATAVTTITSQTIEGRPNASYIQTLQGQVPGLNISTEGYENVMVGMDYKLADSTSVKYYAYAPALNKEGTYDSYDNANYWALGNGATDGDVSIRGAAVINGKANALFIIDGVPVGEQDYKQLKARDILSFTVLSKPDDIAPYGDRGKNGVVLIITQQGMAGLQQVQARKNFNETAFFLPQLHTDKKGNISFTFTSPEALTEWKLRLLSHNKQAVSGYFEKKFFTQKDLMVVPNMPRFLRETDTITISAKITNMTAEQKTGNALLQLFDAVTLAPVDVQMGNTASAKPFTITANGNTTVTWTIAVPTGLQGVQYKVLAKAGNFTDGEENILPVLTNSMLVTESLPLWVRENSTKTYTFDNFKNNTSTTLRHQSVTLEYTSNPAWLALKALPYLMEFEHECAEQVFSRFYANSIATHIIDTNPKIAEVFAAWRKNDEPSRLEQNEELKSVILAETPWLLDNQSEEEQKNRLALLFDLNKMKTGLDANFKKLQDKQMLSGGFPWFEGSPENEYITRHIVAGFGHLSKLGILDRNDSLRVAGITQKAVPYIDNLFLSRHTEAKKLRGSKDNFRMPYPYSDLHYLYTRSFYLKQFPMGDSLSAAIKPYLKDIKQKWTDYTLYEKGLAALVLNRYGEVATAQKVLTYLKGSSANNEEVGMHWLDNKAGWWWYQAPIETQALLIEAFAEVGNDTKSVDAMKVWLIKQKQNKNWPTTKATTEAVYALLMQGTDWLSVQGGTTFTLGNKAVLDKKMAEAQKEAGTGYIKLQWKPEEISKDMATLTVENKSAVPGYGGFYWQYFENLDKIKPAQEGLMNIKKELYRKNTAAENTTLEPITEKTPLKVGDLVTVLLVLTIKEDVEYVHLKDMRAAAFEPVDVLSGYHYKDGLGYYQSTRDAATNFFFSYINRGTYVLEYDVRVNNAGQFSNGITTIQSMYAPEFSGHSQGVRVRTE